MSEETKKIERSEPETSATELPEQDLNKVAGGIVAANPAQARESTTPTVSEIVITKHVDSSSPNLF
jgi:hypothetical protein